MRGGVSLSLLVISSATMSTLSTAAPLTPSARQAAYAVKWRREHLFFTVLPIAMLIAVFVGFSQTYYLKTIFGTPELRWLFHLHGVVFSSWMLLMVIQPALVLAGRLPSHRQIGWIGAGLAAVMTVLAWFVSVDMGRRGSAPPGVPPLVFMTVPMATLIVFPAFVAAAVYWRNNPDTHKRLMLIATCELVPAGIARWPGLLSYGPLAFFGGTDLFLVAIAIYDVVMRRRLHPATAIGGALLIGSQVGRLMLGATATWDAFARWAIS
jgi:hypothetical protein